MLRFLLLALGSELTWSRPPLPQTMLVASVPLGLVSMQAPLISRSTRSAKLPFFQKAVAVVMIADFACIQGYKERREGVYVRDKLNIRANAPSPLLSKSSVQKGGAYFWELTVRALKINLIYCTN